jgi:hypothetical protein
VAFNLPIIGEVFTTSRAIPTDVNIVQEAIIDIGNYSKINFGCR